MNDTQTTTDTAVTEVAVAEAPALTFNAETGTFEAVSEVAVTNEGEVATTADVTVH